MEQGEDKDTTGGRAIDRVGKMGYKPGKYTGYKSYFHHFKDNAQKPNYNKCYLTCYIPITTIAILWDVSVKKAREILSKYKIKPRWYARHNATYLVNDIVKAAKKEGIEFVIPVGLFDTGDYVYVGHEFCILENIWHPGSMRRFMSLLEMYTRMGIPVRNVYIAPRIIPKLEDDYLYAECKLLAAYNKTAEEKRHLILCTKLGNREEALKILEKYNKLFPGTVCVIDFDHLIHLRKLAHKNYIKRTQCLT